MKNKEKIETRIITLKEIMKTDGKDPVTQGKILALRWVLEK